MRFDCHIHTPFCGHAFGSPTEFVNAAAELDIGLITVTCHIPMAEDGFGGPRIRMAESDLPAYFEWIDRTRDAGKELGVEVLQGIEAEIFPDEDIMKRMEDLIAAQPFDFVLGSLHHQLSAWQDWFGQHGATDDKGIIEAYFEQLAIGAQSGRYHSIAHPDVIRLYGTLWGSFRPDRHERSIQAALDAIAASGTCLEVNTSGRIKGDYVIHPDPRILDWVAERNIPLTLGSDAHGPNMVGQYFDETLQLLDEKGFRELNYFRNGERTGVGLERLVM